MNSKKINHPVASDFAGISRGHGGLGGSLRALQSLMNPPGENIDWLLHRGVKAGDAVQRKSQRPAFVGRVTDPAKHVFSSSLNFLCVLCLPLCPLWFSSALADDVVRPEQVVQATLAHSPALQIAAGEVRGTAARASTSAPAGLHKCSRSP